MSDIWLRKIKTYFHVLDVKKKVVIGLEDFLLMPKRFADKEKGSSDLRDKAIKDFHDVRYLRPMKYSSLVKSSLTSIKLAIWGVQWRTQKAFGIQYTYTLRLIFS